MASVKPELIAFNGGEIGVKTLARVDLNTYSRCAEEMENIFIEPQGSMSKAPGTLFIDTAPAGDEVLLRSFEYSVSDNLVMVWSDESMKLISDDAFLEIEGADATIGTFSDESAAASTGGDAAPDLTPITIDWDWGGDGYWRIASP